MIKISKLTLGMLITFLVFVSLVSIPVSTDQVIEQATPLVTPTPLPPIQVEVEELYDITNLPLQDNNELYQFDNPSSVVTIYVTVRKGNSLENTNYTWQEVNNFSKWTDGSLSANTVVGNAEVIVQFGDENGPLPEELGHDAIVPNGTIQIRGASTSDINNPQKSYKIELYEDAGTWHGQSTFALNKHIYDMTRVLNKLSFDMLKEIPNMVTLRTQFVHLYVKDETIEPISNNFVDYGLFTQVEQINKAFLVNHNLDSNAQLYKATSFEFYRYEDQILMEDDPLYDEAEFSHRLEIKGNRDHSKLISMLDDINNYEIPISESFEKYFNLDNYFTWMAFNILIGNIDTQNQNFFLYSPQSSEKWYFIPWDQDGSLGRQEREALGNFPYLYWETGIANYWGGVLHNRVLRLEKYRLMLSDKINELSLIFTPEKIEDMLKIYRAVAEPYAFRLPDVRNLDANRYQYELAFSLVPTEIPTNRELYFESLSIPMPFYLGTPEITNELLIFNWDESYNFTPQDITYQFQVSKDIQFNNIVFETEVINITTVQTPVFESGAYFWRAIAINEDGKSQQPFDAYGSPSGHRYGGMKYLLITPSGEILESEE